MGTSQWCGLLRRKYDSDFEIPYELLHFALLHYALEKLLHFASMLLHFAAIVITFCGDCYYILRRNTVFYAVKVGSNY